MCLYVSGKDISSISEAAFSINDMYMIVVNDVLDFI